MAPFSGKRAEMSKDEGRVRVGGKRVLGDWDADEDREQEARTRLDCDETQKASAKSLLPDYNFFIRKSMLRRAPGARRSLLIPGRKFATKS